ncbi:7-carboxy-7-deazaguanine synthase QueE [Candidatus Formimonas warabiya]|uniref:7-carboxy-7-deazaguanine synthase n=1 Tax=Formimonas warabiya TaxID=1761012 RepID=A0A3G1KPE7_FORW1|nr:7-carboxy-7-deazaguanine synthase QueE [Candidatus Formimonas warabiya]ATW24343.1 hypothetical protein DCMF_05685 [Candidatus Formimonas warabiya]
MDARIQEIFSSIQGEGIYLGVRQIFLRFWQCNLRCTYCDTGETLHHPPDSFFVQRAPGSKSFISYENPISPRDLLLIIKGLHPARHHSLSITGGEPLLQEQFLREFLALFQGLCPVFLETNGTLCEALERVLPFLAIISMDMKLPSAAGVDLWRQHEDFLRIAHAKEVYVKVVITADTGEEEIDKVVQIIQKVDRSIPLVLQPVTPVGKVKEIPPEKVIALQDRCGLRLSYVRVIPQVHKLINQL